MEYKGYKGEINFSNEDEVYYGKLMGIQDLVNFEANTEEELKHAFEEAVEDYLEFCKLIY